MHLSDNFTPGRSLLGGLCIGAASAIYVYASGRIPGVSGVVKNVMNVRSKASDWYLNTSFVSGMLLTGTIASLCGSELVSERLKLAPEALVVGGLLVGAGAKAQNGCTSGHGVCGLSRMSPSSLILTMSFMLSGFVFASLLRQPALAMLDTGMLLPHTLPGLPFKGTPAILAVAGLAISAIRDNVRRCLAGAFTGSLFGLGLMLGGMLSPSKVVAFLRPFDENGWDISLAFVMGGAIAIALPMFQFLAQKAANDDGGRAGPPLFPQEKFRDKKYLQPSHWSARPNKLRSLLGALAFGCGWAMCGVCPGPALVLTGATGLTGGTAFFFPAMLAGLLFL